MSFRNFQVDVCFSAIDPSIAESNTNVFFEDLSVFYSATVGYPFLGDEEPD
ncbi:MAG: hypothetical protein HKN14_08860 [Marinicaulis sp.]|nr:hypothetical protein [Marinicaulis sp.]NNE41014.1 hypothetical protein [Marinicaulis sp.]